MEARSQDDRDALLTLIRGEPGIRARGLVAGMESVKQQWYPVLLSLVETGTVRREQDGRAFLYFPGVQDCADPLHSASE